MTDTTEQKPRVENEEQAAKRIEAAFWRRYNSNPDLQQKLAGKDRVILLDVTDGAPYTFRIVNGQMKEVSPARPPRPDVVISLTRADLLAMFNGELKPLQAYMSRRVKVKASFGDILFAKSLLGW